MEEERRGVAICPLVEIDFFRLEQRSPQQQQQPVPSNFVKSIRGIQKAASRLSPDLLRYVISGHNNPQASHLHPFQTPIRPASLTFMYNGSVSVIQTTTDKAEDVMKMVETEKLKQQLGFSMKDFNPTRDLPLFRTKSLQRFLEKRRERLKSVSPYSARRERLPSLSSSSSSSSSCCSSC